MKIRTTTVLIALAPLVLASSLLQASDTRPEAMISHARSVMLGPDAPRDAIIGALVEVLDATLLILPNTEYAGEFKSRMTTVRQMLVEGALFSDKVHQYLGLAYKLVAGGKAWQIPEELKAPYREADMMEQAKKVSGKLIDSALAERKAGRNEQSVRFLLEFVLMVLTPVEA